jgi:hypothetical protein
MGPGQTTPSDTDRGLAGSFWTLANLVCAFAVAQMIAYMMAAGAKESKIAGGVHDHWGWIVFAIVVASAAYTAALHYFAFCHWKLLGAEKNTIRMLCITSIVRIGAMLSINAVGVLVTIAIGNPPA